MLSRLLTSRLLPVVLVVPLLALAFLQLRWVNELAAAEELRIRRTMAAVGHGIAEDLDAEVGRLMVWFGPPADGVAGAVRSWREYGKFPELLAAVYLLELPREAASSAPFDRWAGAVVSQLQEPTGEWVETEPNKAQELIAALSMRPIRRREPRSARSAGGGPPGAGPGGFGGWPPERWRGPEWPRQFVPRVPMLVRPLSRDESGARMLLVVLDRDSLEKALLPAVIDRRLGEAEKSLLRVRVVDLETERSVFGSNLPFGAGSDVLRVPLLGLEPGRERALSENSRNQPLRPRRPGAIRRLLGDSRFEPPGVLDADREGPWILEVAPEGGSIVIAVNRSRRRNLTMGLAVLSLLALATGLATLSARRAQQLLTRHTEFVAGLSHELNTPVASLLAAGANLADGVVTDERRMREYGRLIQRESSRLGELVSRVLDLARLRRPQEPGDPPSLAVAAVATAIVDAAASAEFLAEQKNAAIVIHWPPGDRERLVVGMEETVLVRCLSEILQNALKYGARRVDISTSADARRTTIMVTDDGPGIPGPERRLVLEPFYRGREHRESNVPGSGLGLHLVAAHVTRAGGAFDIESPPRLDTEQAGTRGSSNLRGGTRVIFRLPNAGLTEIGSSETAERQPS